MNFQPLTYWNKKFKLYEIDQMGSLITARIIYMYMTEKCAITYVNVRFLFGA